MIAAPEMDIDKRDEMAVAARDCLIVERRARLDYHEWDRVGR